MGQQMADDLFDTSSPRPAGEILVLEAQTADEFVATLRPSRAEWWDNTSARRTHIFRGQGDSAWPLLPNGLRPLGVTNRLTPLYAAIGEAMSKTNPAASEMQWIYALGEATTQFAALGRQIGIETPWHIPFSAITIDGLQSGPADHDLGLLALAQHHQIPTELLDWSEDPLTAAFFALDQAELNASHLAVWALTANPRSYILPDLILAGSPGKVLLERSSTIGNSNIRAQSGMFMRYERSTLQSFHKQLCKDGEWRAFETFPEIAQNLTKITLPRSERSALQRLLLAEGRSAAHLMPSWDKVSETLFDRWDKALF